MCTWDNYLFWYYRAEGYVLNFSTKSKWLTQRFRFSYRLFKFNPGGFYSIISIKCKRLHFMDIFCHDYIGLLASKTCSSVRRWISKCPHAYLQGFILLLIPPSPVSPQVRILGLFVRSDSLAYLSCVLI